MQREIYEVSAKVVDASGAYNNLQGYPVSFDSHQNGDDLKKTYYKACASFDAASSSGNTSAAAGRPLTIVSLLRVSDGRQIDKRQIGDMPELPDPAPAPEPEPEQNGGE